MTNGQCIHLSGMDTTHPTHPKNTAIDSPQAFEGVLTRRSFAAMIDVFAIGMIATVLTIVVAVVTFGVGAVLLWLLLPVLPLLSIAYVGVTMSKPSQATWGMRLMGIRLERLDGRRVDGFFAVLHAVLFWASVTLLTPFVLLIGLFTDRRQLGHDLLLGTAMVRADQVLR